MQSSRTENSHITFKASGLHKPAGGIKLLRRIIYPTRQICQANDSAATFSVDASENAFDESGFRYTPAI